MKKLLSLLLILLLSFSLVACGDKDKNGGAINDREPLIEDEEQQEPEVEKDENNKEKTLKELFAAGRNLDNYSYDLYIAGGGFSSEGKVSIKGGRVRTEFNHDGIKSILIDDAVEGYSYIYLPDENQATKMSAAWGEDMNELGGITPEDFYQTFAYDDAYEDLGRELLNGMQCRVLRINDSLNGESTIWLSESLGVPVKIESAFEGEVTVIEFRNIVVGKVKDDTFKIPAGVEIIDLDALYSEIEVEEYLLEE